MTDVLVVESEALVRRMVVEVLRDAGLRVTEADGAEAALRTVDAMPAPPDVLVTGLALGRGALDGRALAAELRRRAPNVGVVYLGGRPAAADPAPDGAPDARERFLPRPFEPARLARVVCEMAPPCPKPPRRVRGMDVMR